MFKELQKCVRDRGPAPIVTWVSDIGRIELSAITFNNAISKASNFLVDGLELEEVATVSVSLGNHWQSAVWLGTALSTGLTIVEYAPAITFGDKSQAQTWQRSFKGRVVDSSSLKPIADATISIFSAKDTMLLNFGFTTPNGNFTLSTKSNDSVLIIISILGKYSNFPSSSNPVQMFSIIFSISFPPILILVIPFLYTKSIKNLKYILE